MIGKQIAMSLLRRNVILKVRRLSNVSLTEIEKQIMYFTVKH